MLDLFDKHHYHTRRPYVLNQVTKYIFDNQMLPAMCFILSKKQIEIAEKKLFDLATSGAQERGIQSFSKALTDATINCARFNAAAFSSPKSRLRNDI